MKTTKQLQYWFNTLSLDDRLQVQIFKRAIEKEAYANND